MHSVPACHVAVARTGRPTAARAAIVGASSTHADCTDSLSATALKAIGYSVPQAAVAALGAGADMVLFNADAAHVASITRETGASIVAAVQAGTLDRTTMVSAVAHVLSAKNVDLCASR